MVKIGDCLERGAHPGCKRGGGRRGALLATDLSIEAELIALIYRYRWQIELFFKCSAARFVEVKFPLQLRPRLVIEFSEDLSILLEDHNATP